MKLEEITLIENELGIVLPETYKKAVIEAKLVGTDKPYYLYNDAYKVISINRRLRTKGIHGITWRNNHFAIGYDSHGSVYYFIDLNDENGPVYQADRTKGWRYSPEDISQNYLKVLSTIEEYVDYYYNFYKLRENHDKSKLPELTNEEKQKKIADFFSQMNIDLQKKMNNK